MSWKIDPAHSEISFKVRHMMISKVRGNFERFHGEVNLDRENPQYTQVHVEIDPASIDTHESRRDDHLRSPDFFNAAQYPTITFASTRVERTGDRTAKLHGDLTIRDITKPVTVDVQFLGGARSPWGVDSLGFSGKTVINRKDWDLTWNQTLETGGVLVGDDIEVDIELELMNQPETEKVAEATD